MKIKKSIVVFSLIGTLVLLMGLYLVMPYKNQETTTANTNNQAMITFIFDDGNSSIYNNAYPLFEEKGYEAAVAIDTLRWTIGNDKMSRSELSEMQDSGWEIMSHSVTHQNNDESSRLRVAMELFFSKAQLELLGFDVNQYVAPYSTYPLEDHKDLLMRYYDAGYTQYVDAAESEIGEIAFSGDVDKYEFHRANMEGKTIEQLKEYVDFVEENDAFLVLYEHEIGSGEKYTSKETLAELLDYIESKDIEVSTGIE